MIGIESDGTGQEKRDGRRSPLERAHTPAISIARHAGTFAKTTSVFSLLGPPIGGLTFMLMLVYILPLPGPMGFGEAQPLVDELIKFFGFLFVFVIPGSYIYVPLAMLCGLATSVVKILTFRQDLQIATAMIAGCMAGLYFAWPEFSQWGWDYHVRAGIDGMVTCIVPSLCCGYLTRTKTSAG